MTEKVSLGKVSATAAAEALLAEIIADHGPVLFHQSGGCCDGSSPMCYPRGEFLVGDHDVLLGTIGDAPVYISETHMKRGSTPTDHRRGARPRRHVLARQRPREALPDPLDRLPGAFEQFLEKWQRFSVRNCGTTKT